MEEFFKGLVERARYYEQFESFRDRQISGQIQDPGSEKISCAEYPKVSP